MTYVVSPYLIPLSLQNVEYAPFKRKSVTIMIAEWPLVLSDPNLGMTRLLHVWVPADCYKVTLPMIDPLSKDYSGNAMFKNLEG